MRRLGRVIWREVRHIALRPLLWFASLGGGLFVALFLSTVFGDGEILKLPIGVVDLDHTPTSRSLIRTLDASPKLSVGASYTSSYAAVEAMRRREIYGFVVFPDGLERAMVGGEALTIPYYYHYALMSIGGEVATALRTILEMASVEPIIATATALGVPAKQSLAVISPTSANIHPLGNATLNYRTYLAEPFFFIMLQILILLTTLYIIGCERMCGSGTEWLGGAGGNMTIALIGKLLPYTLAFAATSVAAIAMLHPEGMSLNEASMQMLYTLLLIAASQAIAVFIYALVPAMALSMSFLSMMGSIGATLSGVTFPVMAMYPIFRHLSLLLPVRHFTLLLQGESLTDGWLHVVALLAFLLLPLLTIGRLRRIMTTQNIPT